MKSRQVEHLTGFWAGAMFIMDQNGHVWTGATYSAMINGGLSSWYDTFDQQILVDNPNGSDTTIGVYTDTPGEIKLIPQGTKFFDTGKEVIAMFSRRSLLAAPTLVTGFDIGHLPNVFQADAVSTLLRFDVSSSTLSGSADGGLNWATPVDISTMVEGDTLKIGFEYAGGTIFVPFFRNAVALPVADQTEALNITNAYWSMGLFTYDSNGKFIGYSYDHDTNGDQWIIAGIPVAIPWSSITPGRIFSFFAALSSPFINDSSQFFNADDYVVENVVATALNTSPDLTRAPRNVEDVSIFINGERLTYGPHFTITNQTINYLVGTNNYHTNILAGWRITYVYLATP